MPGPGPLNSGWENKAGWQLPVGSNPDRFLPIENTPLDDGSDAWWSVSAGYGVAVPLTLAAASLSVPVGIAGSFNKYNDEVVPWASSESSMLGTFGQRGRHETRFIKWQQVDELPTAAAPVALDDVYLIPPRGVIPEPNGIFWATDEGSIPGVVPDEEYWWRTGAAISEIPRLSPRGEDEVVTAAAATIAEEDLGIPASIPRTTAKYPAGYDDQIPQQATTLVEEEYWIPLAVKIEPIVVYTIIHADEVFPSIAAEEGGWEPPYRIQPAAQMLPLADIEIVPQPTPLNIDEIYQISFYVSSDVRKVSMPQFVENDVPVLSTPVASTLVEWLVRARRRGVR